MRFPKGPSPKKMSGGKVGAPALKKMRIGKAPAIKIRKPKFSYS